MADAQRDSGAPEQDRNHDGVGKAEPARGSEGDRGNAAPQTTDAAAVTHGSRTIAGADGPIEIVEDSGAAAGDIDAES